MLDPEQSKRMVDILSQGYLRALKASYCCNVVFQKMSSESFICTKHKDPKQFARSVVFLTAGLHKKPLTHILKNHLIF